MNYLILNDCLYLHCAKTAYLLQAIARDDRVCFTVIPQAKLVPEHITEVYESVILYGQASLVEDSQERQAVLNAYTFRLGQVSQEIGQRYLAQKGPRTALVRIRPCHITAKANRRYLPVEERLKG